MDNNTPQTNGTSNTQNGYADELWEEFEIPVPWGKVLGKWWGPKETQPVLALHGWQDNAGSFDTLIPLLSRDIAILAIDLPGHGRSSHYPKGMHYYLFWDGISLIRRIVRMFGWKKVDLLGHSLGGALTFMYAACFPNDVNKLINIDMAGPTVRDLKKQAALTGSCIDKFLDYEVLPDTKKPSYNYDDMISLVVDAYAGSVDEKAVKILMKRGMSEAPSHINPNGYAFARDLRLKVSIMGMFTVDQILSYAERIRCKVLNIRAIPGMPFEQPEVYTQVVKTMKENAELVIFHEIMGTHHIHLVTPEKVSQQINDFLHL